MLAQLVRLEYIFNKKMIVFSAIMILIISAVYPLLIPEVSVSFAVGAIYLGFLPVSLIAKASKFGVEGTICTLPVTRREIVLGKYVFIGGIATILFLVFVLVLIVAPYDGYSASNVLNLNRITSTILAMAIVLSLILPLVIRYGYNGVMIFILGLNILTVVAFIFTAAGGTNSVFDFLFSVVPQAVRSFQTSLGKIGYAGFGLVVGSMFLASSYVVSSRLYARRDM